MYFSIKGSIVFTKNSICNYAVLLDPRMKNSIPHGILFTSSLGIYALARQWKTVIAGAEGVQNIFVSTHPRIKKPVVGRGNLPAKHLQYLNLEHENTSFGGSGGINSGVMPQGNECDAGVTIHDQSGNQLLFFF